QKSGLGSAAVAGFQWALERDYELIATLDADLSHDPGSLAKMVATMDKTENRDLELALGSRYVEGGKTEGWPLTRRLASRLVNFYSRLVLRLKTRDNSGAFRIYRRSAIEQIDLSSLKSDDFAYLQEIVWRLKKMNIKMKEFPITFRNRTRGKSKATISMGIGIFWKITKMAIGLWR
ncbi:MAG: glycosyltransferase, partial [Planctomycetota bacterium]